ncbi:MAG TPA: hypothetical protein VN922_10670, partial [Bacteroidia bacterium]|nr:hypothetical protein [Bacteroidia bacterium]
KPLNYSKVKEVQLIVDPNAPPDGSVENTPPSSGSSKKAGHFDFENSELSPVEEFKSKAQSAPKKIKKDNVNIVVPPKQTSSAPPAAKPAAPSPGKSESTPPKKHRGPSQTALDF